MGLGDLDVRVRGAEERGRRVGEARSVDHLEPDRRVLVQGGQQRTCRRGQDVGVVDRGGDGVVRVDGVDHDVEVGDGRGDRVAVSDVHDPPCHGPRCGGPDAISSRAIAREMGMIRDVYTDLVDAVEAARDAWPVEDVGGRLLAWGRRSGNGPWPTLRSSGSSTATR
ncbi:hypothetical protein GCM10029964_104090 [Kibdelosporangium lantanae]